jgi:CBS domain-containing protein
MRHKVNGDLLAVRVRRIASGDGEGSATMTVYCETRGQSMPLAECQTCEHCAGICFDRSGRASFLICRRAAPVSDRPKPWSRLAKRILPSLANQTRISQVMTADVHCVTADVSVEALTALFVAKNIGAAPVVDRDGSPIGMVSKTDLIRDQYERGDTTEQPSLRLQSRDLEIELGEGFHLERIARATVGEIMMPIAFTLEEHAPLGDAAALMATEGIHHLPVVSSDGKVVGMLSALDILRWVAAESHH